MVNDPASGSVSFYLNGQLVTTATGITAQSADGDLLIGGHDAYASKSLDGRLDDAQVIPKALHDADVSSPVWDNPHEGAAGRYDFDEASGTTAIDRSDAIEFGGDTQIVTGGYTGKGLSFDGAGDYATVKLPASPAEVDFTIAAWIKMPSLPGGDSITLISQR